MENLDPSHAPKRVPWTPRDMLAAGLTTAGLFVGGLFALSAAAFAMGINIASPEAQRSVMVASMFILTALMIPPVWWWGLRKYGQRPTMLGLRHAPLLRTLMWVGLGLAAILVINVVWAWVMQRLDLPGQPDIVEVFGQGWGGFLSAVGVAVVMAPLAEEVFFRGFLYAGLRDRWGLTAGILASSVIFGLVHLTPGVILPIVLMGGIFAWLYQATGTLWAPILLHAIVNAIAVTSLYAARGF